MSRRGKSGNYGRRSQIAVAFEVNPLRIWFMQLMALVGFLLAVPIAIALCFARLRS